MQDALHDTLTSLTGRVIKIKVGTQDYVGEILDVNDEIVVMRSGRRNPVQIVMRLDVIDAILMFEEGKEEWN
jgi:hypothetical protein